MSDPKLSWREGLETFLRRCCYNSSGIAVLSAEEEQMVFRRLSPEEYQAFQRSQLILFGELLAVFGIPVATIDPRLFGNLALAMIMVRKAMPEGLPFLFPEMADEMVSFQIGALADALEQSQGRKASTRGKSS